MIKVVAILFLSLITIRLQAQNLESEFLYKVSLVLDKPIDTGKSPFGSRITYPVKGGTFEGPKMKGIVKAVGEDWLMKIDERTNLLDVRIVLKTDDNQIISCTYKGIVRKTSEESSYWRITPTFQTGSEKYDWMNYIIAVGKGSFADGKVTYEVFAIN